MASLWKQKNSPYWYVRFTDPLTGEDRRKSTGTTDRKTADLIRKEIEIRLAKGKFQLERLTPSRSMSEFVKEYLANYSAHNKSHKTIEIEKQAFANWIHVIGDILISDVSARLVERFKSELKKQFSPTTVNMRFRALRAAFSIAVKWEYLEKNPFKGIKELPVNTGDLPRSLSPDQINDLFLLVTDKKLLLVFELYLNTGGRLREVANLEWQDIDLTRKMITFRHETKFNKKRAVGLNSRAIEVLSTIKSMADKIQPGDKVVPYSPWHISKKFKYYVRKAGLPESITFHSIRHTFCSLMIQNSVDIYTVKELMGHSSLKVTERYSHLSNENLIKAVEKLKY
jgi:integrase